MFLTSPSALFQHNFLWQWLPVFWMTHSQNFTNLSVPRILRRRRISPMQLYQQVWSSEPLGRLVVRSCWQNFTSTKYKGYYWSISLPNLHWRWPHHHSSSSNLWLACPWTTTLFLCCTLRERPPEYLWSHVRHRSKKMKTKILQFWRQTLSCSTANPSI